MKPTDINKLRSLTSFSALVDYLRDELDWPIEVQDAVDLDDFFYSYEPAELGIDQKHAVKIESIKQFRPLVEGQPWGIFYLQFESKRLPVAVLRRILGRMGLAPAERTARTVLWVWNPALLLIFVADGHNDALMLFCLLAGTYLLWRGRGTRQLFWWSTAGLLVMGLASLSKPIGLLPLPFFFLYALRPLPNWRSRLGLTAVCNVMGVLTSALAFWPFANLEAEGASLLQLAQRLLSEAGASGRFSPAVWVILISRHFDGGWRLTHAATLGNLVLAVGGLVLLWRGIRGRHLCCLRVAGPQIPYLVFRLDLGLVDIG